MHFRPLAVLSTISLLTKTKNNGTGPRAKIRLRWYYSTYGAMTRGQFFMCVVKCPRKVACTNNLCTVSKNLSGRTDFCFVGEFSPKLAIKWRTPKKIKCVIIKKSDWRVARIFEIEKICAISCFFCLISERQDSPLLPVHIRQVKFT